MNAAAIAPAKVRAGFALVLLPVATPPEKRGPLADGANENKIVEIK
ncbi:MAG: hypothetical protein AAFR04_03780 [Pseudomonadota bacterium]